jgi:3',5'-nucleoside bisphosphate phosphatase
MRHLGLLVLALAVPAFAASAAELRTDWDLHTHTDCSDGLKSAAVVVEEAAREGVRVLAISDHDTFECVEAAREAAERFGVRLLPAIEISAEDDSVHVLGIDVDPRNPRLRAVVAHMHVERIRRMKAILAKLADLTDPASGRRIEVSLVDDLLCPRVNGTRRAAGLTDRTVESCREAGEDRLLAELRGQITRPDAAEALIRLGFAKNKKDAFDRWLGDDAPARVNMAAIPALDAIGAIHGGGGLAILAHPYYLFRKRYPWIVGDHRWESPEELIGAMIDAGLDGIEVFRAEGPQFTEERWRIEAIVLGHPRPPGCELLRTPGTDFHGAAGSPPFRVGHAEIPAAELLRIEQRLGIR